MKCLALFFVAALHAFAAAREQVWEYKLLEGSYLTDECLICGRPTINNPMRGSFTLRLVQEGPLATDYAIENFEATAGSGDLAYEVHAAGTYRVGGNFALTQNVFLSGEIQHGGGQIKAAFTNESASLSRALPMLYFVLKQTNGTLASTFTLDVAAAPIREIWFSTDLSFHSAAKPADDNSVTSGDLLSSTGRIVKHNSDFQEHFPGPTYENMGLDALDILPGANIVFSTDTLGVLSDGDFAFARDGKIVRWQNFMNIVAPPLSSDPGLDALHFSSATRFYFSIERDVIIFQDPGPNITLLHGDILWVDMETSEGGVFKENHDLLALFHPADIKKDYGFDALYIWPSGEIWFSTAEGFSDSQLGPIDPGDLLSDRGYIVFRNRDLVNLFMPLEDISDFGLDAVTIISDAAEIPEGATLKVAYNLQDNSLLFTWTGAGRVFQVERATSVTGPWEPISPIIAELSFQDSIPLVRSEAAFFRLRQW